MELYILRHGTTSWNKRHLLQGSSDISLDEEGRALARETGEGMKDIVFDRCFTSPLSRARETAELVLAGRGIPITEDVRLAERCFGIYEGMDVSPGSPVYSPEIEALMRFDLTDDRRPDGGETLGEMIERTASFYRELVSDSRYEDERILLSMHGASGRALMYSIWGGPDFWHGSVPKNCSVCIVKLRQGQVVDIRKDVAFYNTEVPDFYGTPAEEKKA